MAAREYYSIIGFSKNATPSLKAVAGGHSGPLRFSVRAVPLWSGFMPQHFKTKLWEVEIPDGWAARGSWAGGEAATFYKPDGVGLLRLFASPLPADYKGLAKESLNYRGRMSGSTSSGTRGQNFYRKWAFVTRQGMIISVDYSCTIEHADLEQREVDQIMQTLGEV